MDIVKTDKNVRSLKSSQLFCDSMWSYYNHEGKVRSSRGMYLICDNVWLKRGSNKSLRISAMMKATTYHGHHRHHHPHHTPHGGAVGSKDDDPRCNGCGKRHTQEASGDPQPSTYHRDTPVRSSKIVSIAALLLVASFAVSESLLSLSPSSITTSSGVLLLIVFLLSPRRD